MRSRVVYLALIVAISASAWAQNKTTPRFELFGGYTYLRSNPGDGFNGANSSGWESSLNWNWNRWLGLKGDVSGHYCCDGQTEHNFLFGPQITFRHQRANIFFHGLFGISHGTDTGFSETTPAWVLGGGLDWKFKRWPRVAFRPIQADYLGTHYSDSTQHNFRYSAGFVFSFGGNK